MCHVVVLRKLVGTRFSTYGRFEDQRPILLHEWEYIEDSLLLDSPCCSEVGYERVTGKGGKRGRKKTEAELKIKIT